MSLRNVFLHQTNYWVDRIGLDLIFCILVKKSWFFPEIVIFSKSSKIPLFSLFRPKKYQKLTFSTKIWIFLKNMQLQLQFGIFTFLVRPVVPEILCSKLKCILFFIFVQCLSFNTFQKVVETEIKALKWRFSYMIK